VTDTESPGWYRSMILVRSLGLVTAVPPTLVMTSPGARPACCAGVPGMTFTMAAPLAGAAVLDGVAVTVLPNPKPPGDVRVVVVAST
jgi:hypothetical protein